MMKTNAKSRMNMVLAAAMALWASSPVGWASDWPQFMGPNGDGVSPEKGLLRAWPAEGPKVLWRAGLGPGYGAAAIRDGKIYVLDRLDQKDVLRCLDLATGKEQWAFGYDAPGTVEHDGSRSVPAITDKYVFTIGAFGHFHCLDKNTHQVVWKKNLLSDYGTRLPRWAVAQSALPYKDMVIAAPESGSTGVVAFDQATGQQRWYSPPVGALSYPGPKLINLDGMDQIVVVNAHGATAVGAADGKILWRYAHPCKIPIPNVTPFGQGRLFVTGAYGAGSAIIQVSRQDSRWEVKELARIPDIGGHCHPAIAYQEHLYLLGNVNERADGLVCFDFQGNLIWQTKRDPYLDKGGYLLTGDGVMYLMDGQKGELHIIQPSPAGFKSLGKVKLLEGREIWAPLALADGKLVIRDQRQMKCLDLRGR